MSERAKTVMPMTRDEFKSMIGEGFHTAFRKGLPDSRAAGVVWNAIRELPNGEWAQAVEYVAWGFEVSYAPLEWKADTA